MLKLDGAWIVYLCLQHVDAHAFLFICQQVSPWWAPEFCGDTSCQKYDGVHFLRHGSVRWALECTGSQLQTLTE